MQEPMCSARLSKALLNASGCWGPWGWGGCVGFNEMQMGKPQCEPPLGFHSLPHLQVGVSKTQSEMFCSP